MQARFSDFLLDRRVNVISMYGNEDYETVANMRRFAARGQNVFKLDWYTQTDQVRDSAARGLQRRVGAFYPAMKQLGYLDRAYVYGWDEVSEPESRPDLYDEIRYAAEVLAREFPGVRLLSAGTDRSYGTASPLKGLTNMAFCPAMRWDAAAARRSQAAGNQVWWYDVTVYPGEDGPIASLRLENFRDGSEDYGLLQEARRRLAATQRGAERRLLRKATAVGDDFARDLSTFTDEVSLLRRQRERLIRALERTVKAPSEGKHACT